MQKGSFSVMIEVLRSLTGVGEATDANANADEWQRLPSTAKDTV